MHHPLLSRLANDRCQVPPAPAPLSSLPVASWTDAAKNARFFCRAAAVSPNRSNANLLTKRMRSGLEIQPSRSKILFPGCVNSLMNGRTLRKSLPDPEVLGSILCVPEKETLTCDNGPCFSRKMHFSVDGSVAVCVACGEGEQGVLAAKMQVGAYYIGCLQIFGIF